MIISLIGYRATGKSTIAQLLANRLNWSCVDTDVEIQNLARKAIRDIFQQEGESRFRRFESDVIRHLTRRHKLVLRWAAAPCLILRTARHSRSPVRLSG